MNFDTDNPVVRLCATGITTEGTGDMSAAYAMYEEAWNTATNDLEWFIAAHYLARHQSPIEQLKWNEISLQHALKVEDPAIKGSFPSLYLNLGKSYEDWGDMQEAAENYKQAALYADHLPSDGYGNMTRAGIAAALERVKK